MHDNPAHHANQARIVKALQPDALVFEMIEPSMARGVTPEARENAVTLGEMLEWDARGWPDFAMYYPIFAAAPDAAIFGGALPRDTVRRAVREGAAAVFGDGAPLFGIDQPLPEDEHSARMDMQLDAHCGALPPDILTGMVEAQRLRDAALARATVAAWAHAQSESETPQVVVITGNGHAHEDWGMPVMLRSYFGADSIDIRTLAQFETEVPDVAPYTEMLATAPAERPDPCAAFK